jgi:hypothetical protein
MQVDDEDKERISANATSKRVMEDLAKVTVVNQSVDSVRIPAVACARVCARPCTHCVRVLTPSAPTLSAGT